MDNFLVGIPSRKTNGFYDKIVRNATKLSALVYESIFRLLVHEKKQILDLNQIQEALNSKSYNVIILENGWVKDIRKYIDGYELCNVMKLSNEKILDIWNKLKKNNVCSYTIRISLFKRIKFHITGIWDY